MISSADRPNHALIAIDVQNGLVADECNRDAVVAVWLDTAERAQETGDRRILAGHR